MTQFRASVAHRPGSKISFLLLLEILGLNILAILLVAPPHASGSASNDCPPPVPPITSDNFTESNPAQTVHAYNSGSFTVSQQTQPDQYGDQVYSQVTGFVANPLCNGDPNFDYYIFDVYVAVSSGGNNWYADSGGLSSWNGPTIRLNVTCSGPNEAILYGPSNVWPASYYPDNTGSTPVTTSVDLSYGGFDVGISQTFIPPISQTQPVVQQSCELGWASAQNTGDSPGIDSYAFNFAFSMESPKGQPAAFGISTEGSFYHCNLGLPGSTFCALDHTSDYPLLTFTTAFLRPPTTVISSNPGIGVGYVQVDGQPVQTPTQFVWDEGNQHSIAASTLPVRGNVGIQYIFSSWSDGLPQSHNILSPTTATTIVANFQTQFQLNVSIAQPAHGTTSNPTPGSWWYNASRTVVVQATPDNGYALGSWTLDGSSEGNSNTVSVLMNAPHILVASFAKEPTLTVTAGVGGTVTVASSFIIGGIPQVISAGSSNSYTVPIGTTVTLTATPQLAFFFGNWTGTQYSTSNPIAVTVNSDIQETANFALPYVTVTFSAAGLGSTASGTVLIVDGSAYTQSSLPLALKLLVGSSHTFVWTANVTGGQGVRFAWRSASGLTTAQSGTLTITGTGTVDGNYVTQYSVVFQAIGLDYSALGTVLALGGSHVAYSQMPYSVWAEASASLPFNFTSNVPSSVQGVAFTFASSSSASPIFVTGPLTVSASYGRQTTGASSPLAVQTTSVASSTQASSMTNQETSAVSPNVTTAAVSQSNTSTGIDSMTLSIGLAAAVISVSVIAAVALTRRR